MTLIPALSDGASASLIPLLPAPFQPFICDDQVFAVSRTAPYDVDHPEADKNIVYAANILQDTPDYRGLIRRWFALLRTGGRLLIEVPHAFLCERELALPSQLHPDRRRLYTPATLLGEIEEALEPNSYRVRLLCDYDDGYDYASETGSGASGSGQSILTVVERIEPPKWTLATGEVAFGPAPDFQFEPARTRREIVALRERRKVVILKLDHLGDFIMGVPALENARAAFADAEITLVVGSWNDTLARDLGLFEHVLGFDAFPRNSSEEKVDLGARAGAFEALLVDHYDLAIDLRTDPDTRFFLRHLDADVRAGLGTRVQFPFLDIFLPIDGTRHGFEAASEQLIEHSSYAVVAPCRRTGYRIAYDADPVETTSPVQGHPVYGPYIHLGPGEYLYIPKLEIAGDGASLLYLDVACNQVPVAHALASTDNIPQLRFIVEESGASFEFRIAPVEGERLPSFSFYGGRLLKRGASSVLHQSEYLSLLVDLVKMRADEFGLLREDAILP
jgi:hypothetical protein